MSSPPPQNKPIPETASWIRDASPSDALWQGLKRCVKEPGLILALTSVGFGALAQEAQLSLSHSLAMMVVFFALPAQVILVDQISRGASIVAACFAVMLTGVRLVPMTVTLVPHLQKKKMTRVQLLFAVHFIAVTAWLEGMRWVPKLPAEMRFPYFSGVGLGLVTSTLIGTMIGFYIADSMPTEFARVLPFLSPIYFLVSMLRAADRLKDVLPIVAGLIIGPVVYLVAPELDLIVAGLVGGTIAHFVMKGGRDG